MEYTLRGSYVEALQFYVAAWHEMEEFAGRDFDYDGEEEIIYSIRSQPGRSWRDLEDECWVVKFPDGFRVFELSEFEAMFEPLV